MRQTTANGSCLIVAFFNGLNTTAHLAWPIDDVPLREEPVPIHGIRISVNDRYTVSTIVQQPEALPLPVTRTSDGVHVTVPTLGIHSMLVVELQELYRRGVSVEFLPVEFE